MWGVLGSSGLLQNAFNTFMGTVYGTVYVNRNLIARFAITNQTF